MELAWGKIRISIVNFISFGQNSNNEISNTDSIKEIVLSKLAVLNTITIENVSTLKICSDKFNCKGFIQDYDSINKNIHEMNKVAIIKKIAPFEFEIKYKYRESKQFIVDTFNIYCSNDNWSIAVPINCQECVYKPQYFKEEYDFFDPANFMPASTDERDVIFIIKENEEIIFYDSH